MIKKLEDDSFSDDDITFVNKDSNNVTFSSDQIGVFSKDLDNINLILKLLLVSDLWLGIIYLNNTNHLKNI